VPTYQIIFFQHNTSLKLYRKVGAQVAKYHLLGVVCNKVYFKNIPYETNRPRDDIGLYAVDVTYTTKGIMYVAKNQINTHNTPLGIADKSLQHRFRNLPEALQQLCGTVVFPPDNG
jgi:tRNA A-37 threonylcarbamoyl transferase component Bud32